MKTIMIGFIKVYQKIISPVLPRVCRYTPTCSQYMLESIHKKGLIRGVLQGMVRILKCNPFFPGGNDPVT